VSEGKYEGLGGCVDSLARSYHLAGDGGSEKNSSVIAFLHVTNDVFSELYGAGAVEFDHVEFFVEVGVGEFSADPNAGIDASKGERSAGAFDGFPKGLNAFARGEIRLDFDDVYVEFVELCGRVGQAFARGTDHEIISARG
jgi:hypothetical protein